MRCALTSVIAGLVATVAFFGAGCGASSRPSGKGTAGSDVRLLDGGKPAFAARLAKLEGKPVVVNQWASWCGPCRYEFPFFASQARKLKGKVAFLGVNSKDGRESAVSFLRDIPTGFDHFYDPDVEIARVFRGGRSWPTTAFYDTTGKLTLTRPGGYADERALVADIKRYALGG